MTKKKKMLLLLLIFVLLGMSSFFAMFIYQKQASIRKQSVQRELAQYVIKQKIEKIEYGSTLAKKDIINLLFDTLPSKDIEVEIYMNEEKQENYTFSTCGNMEVKVKLRKKGEKGKYIEQEMLATLTIEDSKMPTIEGVSNKEIFVGDTLDLKEGIKAQDEVDGELEVQVEGNVDTNNAGEYKLIYKAVDKNNNVTEKESTVIVKEKITTAKPETTTKQVTQKTTKVKTTKGTTKKVTTTANDASTKNGRLYLAKQEAKRVVANIIKPGMSDLEKATAITRYLYGNVSTQTNQSSEAYKTNFGNEAYAALVMKIAACSGFCKAVTLLCNEAGLESKHINANQWTHQWNEVKIEGNWLVIDAQIGYIGEGHPFFG